MPAASGLNNQWAAFEQVFSWFHDNVLSWIGMGQLAAIGGSYLVARLFAKQVRRHLESLVKDREGAKELLPRPLAMLFGYTLWALLLWFCRSLSTGLGLPTEIFRVAIHLAVGLMIVHVAVFFIRNTFVSRIILTAGLVGVVLHIFDLWSPTARLFDSMVFAFGEIRISLLRLGEATVLFVVLWIAGSLLDRYVSHWLLDYDRLKVSDRILIERAIRVATIAVVILATLRAAGVSLTTLAVTGGAVGFAIGIGLQKIGSNLIGGIMLLVSKAVRVGDVITFERSTGGAGYGWITDIGPIYVHVGTRAGSQLLIPNESFVTQRIENLTLNDNLLRLDVPFGISYGSDLKKAIRLSVSAAMNIGRVLKNPAPKCVLKEFGDSTVNLLLRIWIDDPRNGIHNVMDAVLQEIWDSFHANGIEIAFPQRDLHIKDAVPLRILKEEIAS